MIKMKLKNLIKHFSNYILACLIENRYRVILFTVVFLHVIIFSINMASIGMSNDRITSLKQYKVMTEEEKKFYKKANFRFIAKLGDYPIYLDIHTNLFTYEKKENSNIFNVDNLIFLGNVSKNYVKHDDLFDLKSYGNSYYFDEESELLYFIDWSEKYSTEQKNYSCFCAINNKLEKINLYDTTLLKIEKEDGKTENFYKSVSKYLFIGNDAIIEYNGKNNISVVRNISDRLINLESLKNVENKDNDKEVVKMLNLIEDKLDIANVNLNIYGTNGDKFCYIVNMKNNTWYKYENGEIEVIDKPKELIY